MLLKHKAPNKLELKMDVLCVHSNEWANLTKATIILRIIDNDSFA